MMIPATYYPSKVISRISDCAPVSAKLVLGLILTLPLSASGHQDPHHTAATKTSTSTATNTTNPRATTNKQQPHEHGSVKLGVALDGLKAEIMLEAPGESIFGFEHGARSQDERQTILDAMAKLRNNPTSLFVFDNKSGCQFNSADVHAAQENMLADTNTQVHHDEHSHASLIARWYLTCKSNLSGTKLQLNLIKNFKRIKKIELIEVSGDRQSGRTLTKDEVLDLK